MAVNVKVIFFWDVAPFSSVETDRRFKGACSFRHQGGDGGENLVFTTTCY
jgi:hypothetical protein